MSTTTDTAGPTETHREAPAAPEHPFRGLKEGWVREPRPPRRSGRKVESVLVIELDPERTAWVFAEAERIGLEAQPQRVVESLIDAARAAPATAPRT
jgi:hypothetical protein